MIILCVRIIVDVGGGGRGGDAVVAIVVIIVRREIVSVMIVFYNHSVDIVFELSINSIT
jgi:NAD(P)H-hydrate repair Nnr-like enzyme with NAD(P)H-hydrate epimerase domain